MQIGFIPSIFGTCLIAQQLKNFCISWRWSVSSCFFPYLSVSSLIVEIPRSLWRLAFLRWQVVVPLNMHNLVWWISCTWKLGEGYSKIKPDKVHSNGEGFWSRRGELWGKPQHSCCDYESETIALYSPLTWWTLRVNMRVLKMDLKITKWL